MSRPLRIELAGGLCHVTSRGDRREAIYRDEQDRENRPALLGEVCEQFHWRCHAYCEMTNHYHFVVETPGGEPVKGDAAAQWRLYPTGQSSTPAGGSPLPGRFKAILVERDSYLLELVRYVPLNPVRAGMVSAATDWPWSSYHPFIRLTAAPAWLESDWILGQFGQTRAQARRDFAAFVAARIRGPSLWEGLRHQVLLGSEHSRNATVAPRRRRSNCAKSRVRSAALCPNRLPSLPRRIHNAVKPWPERSRAACTQCRRLLSILASTTSL